MKDSRKRERSILIAAGFVALVSVALWLHVDGAALLRRHASTPTPTAKAPLAKPLPMAAVAPPMASSTPAILPATASTPVAAGVTVKAPVATDPAALDSSARVPTESSAPPVAAPADSAPASSGEADATAPTSAPPPPPSQDTTAAADSAPGTAAPAADAAAHDEPIDLFAQRLAKLEQNDSTDPNDIAEARQLTDFKVRGEDEAAPGLVQVLHQHVVAWLVGFPAERAQRLSLVAVECRAGACQMLIAESAADLSPASTVPFEQALRALLDEGWCRSLGLALQHLSMHAAGGPPGGKADHALWTVYLRWTVSG
jgi:hypothetical protein